MRTVYDAYNYRRFLKTQEGGRGIGPASGSVSMRPGRDDDTRQLVRRRLTPDERERMLLKMAKAERALCLERQPRRERLVMADNVALRRNELGMKYLEQGDYPKAFRNFSEAIARDPGLVLAYNNIGLLYLEIGDLEQAEYHFAAAIDLEPDFDPAYSNRGLMFIELGEYAAAYDDFAKAIELAPDEPLHYNNAGVLFLELDKPSIARDYFIPAIELDPRNPTFYNNRGMAHSELGYDIEAREDFIKAIELDEEQFAADVMNAETTFEILEDSRFRNSLNF